MKKSLKDRITDYEYFRLPQMHTEDTFQEMQRSTSQKYAQYLLGPFPESENQKPYETPEDGYPEREDAYTPWNYPPWLLPEVPPYNYDWPKDGQCANLWKYYWGDWKGGALDPNDPRTWEAINAMMKFGCMVYVPRLCCIKGAQISGPDEVLSGSVTTYTYPEAVGCTYDWNAKLGWAVAGDYTAPVVTTDTYDTLEVHPFMGDDRSIPCATKKIKISIGGCGTSVPSPTTLQMAVSTTQTLTVQNPIGGAVYSWVITAGGGTLGNETPTSIDFTAPAANVDCLQNATIELRRGAYVCGTVKIAIDAAGDYVAFDNKYITNVDPVCCAYTPYSCNPTCDSQYCGHRTYYDCEVWGCNGIFKRKCGYPGSFWICDYTTPPDATSNRAYCTATIPSGLSQCGYGDPGHWGINDKRTPALKAMGCCPIQLM